MVMPVEDAPPDPAGRVLEADIRDQRKIPREVSLPEANNTI